MPELLLELFSEEIPARMQARAAADLARLACEALAALAPTEVQTFYGPRRIALAATVHAGVAASSTLERGPRSTAPEQALAGFLRKHAASREQLVQEGDYWVLHKQSPGQDAAALIAAALPPLLRRFPWPKSMRWGGTGSLFTWVRPLRRILCILDGATVPFSLADGGDDGHGLVSGNQTEGHRFMAPGAFPVHSASEWQAGLLAKRVMVDAAYRRQHIADGVAALAAARQVSVVDDPALLDEVAGLVEWPVPLLGRIDPAFMDLPPEVMQVSMRVNQRYFALRNADGSAAPYFAFAANIEAPDGGATIIAGNERVLRARFSDARHFWDADRRVRLADRVRALDAVIFHAKLGSQGARVHRIMQLAEAIAPAVGADPALAARAAWLAKADLTTGMVGEFPELQGAMGRYYALHDDEDPAVADAVRDHYAPKGPEDGLPTAPVTVAVALADKLDLLASFFAIGEKPTGSGDPYALRRAALGVVRIIREGRRRLQLRPLITLCAASLPAAPPADEVLAFIVDRARVQLRGEGARHDVLDAVFAAGGGDDRGGV
jgi:glycyl-tRNA synthetase beta chain